MRSRRKRNFAALLAMLLLLCGCTSLKSIQEDSVREDLPQIDGDQYFYGFLVLLFRLLRILYFDDGIDQYGC